MSDNKSNIVRSEEFARRRATRNIKRSDCLPRPILYPMNIEQSDELLTRVSDRLDSGEAHGHDDESDMDIMEALEGTQIIRLFNALMNSRLFLAEEEQCNELRNMLQEAAYSVDAANDVAPLQKDAAGQLEIIERGWEIIATAIEKGTDEERQFAVALRDVLLEMLPPSPDVPSHRGL